MNRLMGSQTPKMSSYHPTSSQINIDYSFVQTNSHHSLAINGGNFAQHGSIPKESNPIVVGLGLNREKLTGLGFNFEPVN